MFQIPDTLFKLSFGCKVGIFVSDKLHDQFVLVSRQARIIIKSISNDNNCHSAFGIFPGFLPNMERMHLADDRLMYLLGNWHGKLHRSHLLSKQRLRELVVENRATLILIAKNFSSNKAGDRLPNTLCYHYFMPLLFLLVILVTAVIGLVSSWYVYRHRRHGKTVECVINVECDSIITSRYNNFYSLANDQLGLIYFSITLVLSVIGIITAGALWTSIFLLFLSLAAGFYGLYLIYIQLHVLKHTCT